MTTAYQGWYAHLPKTGEYFRVVAWTSSDDDECCADALVCRPGSSRLTTADDLHSEAELVFHQGWRAAYWCEYAATEHTRIDDAVLAAEITRRNPGISQSRLHAAIGGDRPQSAQEDAVNRRFICWHVFEGDPRKTKQHFLVSECPTGHHGASTP